MAGVNVVFAHTPRGVLGKCFRCNADRMRTCKCFEDRILKRRIDENTDRMSELIASSFDGSRTGTRLAASRPSSAMRPQSAMSGRSFDHRVQIGRPLSAMGQTSNRPGSALNSTADTNDELHHEPELDDDGPIFRTYVPLSSYTSAYSLRATKWAAPPRDQLALRQGKDVGSTFARPKLQFRPGSASSRRQDDEMSQCSDGFDHGVPRQRVDFLLRQLRLLCYRKVKGHGSDVSVREIFRHFDSNKDEDEDGAGIDVDEFTTALRKLMLGTPEDGLVSVEEAACMFRTIDTNNGGTIDYREVAQLLSQPGWDSRLVGRMSNVLL